MATVTFETAHGPVDIELATDDDYGDQDVDRTQQLIERSELTLTQSLAVIRPVADAILDNVSGLSESLETVTAEIALELGGKGRFIVAETHAKASIKVSMTWRPSGKTDEDEG